MPEEGKKIKNGRPVFRLPNMEKCARFIAERMANGRAFLLLLLLLLPPSFYVTSPGSRIFSRGSMENSWVFGARLNMAPKKRSASQFTEPL